MSSVSLVALFFFTMIFSLLFQVETARSCSVVIGGTPYGTVQDAVNAANPGDTVAVSGTACNENVLIKERQGEGVPCRLGGNHHHWQL